MKKPDSIPEGHRWCPKCETVKPLKQFGRDRTRKCGVRSKCYECDNARRKLRWQRSYWTPERLEAFRAREAKIVARIAAAQAVG